MGIKDLNKTLKDLNIIKRAPLSAWKGRAIAVDASNWIYVNWTMAAKRVIFATNLLAQDPDTDAIRKQWFAIAWQSINRFLVNGIYPVFVFDGPAPEEKSDEKIKRTNEKQVYVDKYSEALRLARDQTDILDVGTIDMKSLRQLCFNAYKIDWNEMDMIMYFLNNIGFQVFKPNCEAEKFCSMLCLEGHVAGVFSTDTDNLAYCCPCLITDITTEMTPEGPLEVATYIQYHEVLEASGLSQQQFLDLCIMHGTDYNNRIKGVGPVNINKLIKQYGCIESIAQIHNVSCLNHVRCRELFSYTDTTTLNHNSPVAIQFIDITSLDPEVVDYYMSMFEASTHASVLQDNLRYVMKVSASSE